MREIKEEVIKAFESSEELLKFIDPNKENGGELDLLTFVRVISKVRVLEMQLMMDCLRDMGGSKHEALFVGYINEVYKDITETTAKILFEMIDTDRERDAFNRWFPKWFGLSDKTETAKKTLNEDAVEAFKTLEESLKNITNQRNR